MAVVTWDQSTGATHYKVYYDDFFGTSCRLSSGSPSFCELLAGNVTSTTYTHTSPDDDTNYYWITACNSAGCSDIDSSNPAQFTATQSAATAPGVPTGLTATANGQTQIDLSWTAPSDDGGSNITGYKIEVSTNGSTWSDLVANTNSTSTSYSHTSLTAGSTRHYRVSAINSAGTGTASNVDNATTGAAPAPDLVVDTPRVDASAPAAGARFTLSATVRNQGSGSSAFTTLRYYRSTDSTITTSDTEVGTDQVSALSASGSGAESISQTAPSTPGTYYYGACVDTVPGESNAENNCSTATVVTVGAAPAPDLVVDSPTVDTSAPAAGARFTLNATVDNQGNGSSSSTTLRYYRSTDSAITNSDTSVGTDSVSGLNSSGSGDESISLTAPSSPGTYYYGACVDVVSSESDTTNNCSPAVTVTVGAATAPDLIVSTFTVDNSSPVTGQYFTLNATVNNQGNGSSSSTTLRYYRSTDATITTSDATIGTSGISGYLSVGGLSPSGSEAKSARTSAPFTLGTYYFGACVDTVTGESDTTNNCSLAATVTVQRTNQPPRLTGEVDDKVVELGESFTVDLSGLFTDPDGDEITSYGFTFRTSGILTGIVNTKTGILSLRAIAVGETIVAVDARDSNGQSKASEDLFKVTVVAAEAADKPGAPTGLSATADGQTQIDLSWTAPSDDGGANITGFKIEVSTSGSTWSDLVANTNSTSTSYSHTGLAAGSTRHYRVSAINSAGAGEASDTDSATTDPATPPAPDGACSVDLIVRTGESCTYPGTSTEFSVASDGTGRFLFTSSGSKIELRNSTINGVTYTFVASKQSDGNWRVEEVG